MKPWREYRGPRVGEIASWLSRHARHVTPEKNKDGTTELRFKPSPCCGHDKRPAACINASTGLWKCNACGKVGNWFTLTRAFGDPLPEADRYKHGELTIPWAAYAAHRADNRRPVTMGHYAELHKYCIWRGFSDMTLDAWRVTTKGHKTLRWPIYAWDGKWTMVNARLRVVLDRAEAKTADWFEVKGGPTTLCVGNHLIGLKSNKAVVQAWLDGDQSTSVPPDLVPCTDKRVIVTEGQWDAMVAFELGIGNVLSLPNGAAHMDVAGMLRYVPEDWEVWLAFDMDEAGERAVEKAFAQLGTDRVARIVMPYKDLNDWLMHEQDLTADRVLAAAVGITKAMQERMGIECQTAVTCGEPAPPESRWTAIDDTETSGAELVCETPWPTLNKLISGGLKAGSTTGLLAPSGRGKTTIANQIAIHAAASGTKVGIISLEETRDKVVAKIKKQAVGWTGSKGEEFKKLVANIMLSPLEGSSVVWRDCGREFEAMIAEGAKLLILDNLDYIAERTGGDPHGEKIEAYGQLIELAKQTDTHVLAVWQPKKVDPNKAINSSDQKGLAQAFQDADNYMNLNWFGALRRLELEKHREAGIRLGANHVWLTYDGVTHCMVEVPAEQLDMARSDWQQGANI